MAAGSSRGQTSTAKWATFHRDHYGSSGDRQAASSLPTRPRRGSNPPLFFSCFFVFEASGKLFCMGASRCPATSRERGRQPIINQDTRDRPAAVMPVEQAEEELGPLERAADVRVAARLKASGLKCMCATDVSGDSLGSCFSSVMRFSLEAREATSLGPLSYGFFWSDAGFS